MLEFQLSLEGGVKLNKETQYICVTGSSKVGKTTTIEAILERGENIVD